MIKEIVFATNNANKIKEIKGILGDTFLIRSLKEIGCEEDIPEDQDTLKGNARQKARFIFDLYHIDCFADDTGLEVEALNGAPGVHSARYATQEGHDSVANVNLLLKNLDKCENRKAQFRTVICLIIEGEEFFFEGIVKGHIAREKKGSSGFGYDPVFVPEGYNQSFAELGVDVKNQVSHRARATAKLVSFLRSFDN